MPKPRQDETKDDFLERCIPSVMDEGKESDQATAICNSMWEDKQTKQSELSFTGSVIELKEEEGEFYSEGFIATTHPDRARDPDDGVEGDILSIDCLKQIADFINKGIATIQSIGSTRTVSKQHDWVLMNNPDVEPAGMAMPPAEVREMDDGHYGVYVKTHHNKEHPDYKSIIYKVQNGYYPGYSIEYVPGDSTFVNHDGQKFRFLKSITNFLGYAFASARRIANPMALITATAYKEIEQKVQEQKEEVTMDADIKEDIQEEQPVQEEQVEQPSEPASSEEESSPEVKEEEEQEVEEVSQDEGEAEPIVEQKEVPSVSVKDVAEEILNNKNFKEALENIKIDSKIKHSEGDAMENVSISVKEMQEAVKSGLHIKENLRRYADAAEEAMYESTSVKQAFADVERFGHRQLDSRLKVKCMDKGLKIVGNINVKGTLGASPSVNASEFTQDDVEFADVFAPGIIDTFNNQINLFGFLNKEPHPEGAGSYYEWKMITSKDPDGNDTFAGQGDVSIAKNFSSKGNYRTPLKIARRGVSVTDFINRYSARSLGDLFRLELDLQMKEMMNDIDAAIFAEVADGTGNAPLGLEAVADSAGNTSLYGLTRSTANRLTPDTAANTYEAIGGSLTEARLRQSITYLKAEGSRVDDLAIIAHPTTYSYILNLLDGNRRFMTTDAMFGFNQKQVAQFDSIPIIEDHNCNSDAIYVIDRASAVIVVGMEPRIVNLAKVGAATEAYVQMDFAFVYKQPRRISMLDTLSGPST